MSYVNFSKSLGILDIEGINNNNNNNSNKVNKNQLFYYRVVCVYPGLYYYCLFVLLLQRFMFVILTR